MNITTNNFLSDPLKSEVDKRGVQRLILSRPSVHNCFDDTLINSLSTNLLDADNNSKIRVVVIASEGKNFSAGADVNWMKRMADASYNHNLADATQLANMLYLINNLSKPVIAEVQGMAIGGGVGLIAASDIAIASDQAVFSFSEVRLGLTPSTISPYVIAAIGERAAKRWILTGESFGAEEAIRIGLIHEAVPMSDLKSRVDSLIKEILKNSPKAIKAAKKLIFHVNQQRDNPKKLIKETAQHIAKLRKTPEAREGLEAFLEKRPPKWVTK